MRHYRVLAIGSLAVLVALFLCGSLLVQSISTAGPMIVGLLEQAGSLGAIENGHVNVATAEATAVHPTGNLRSLSRDPGNLPRTVDLHQMSILRI
jgi:hypothetical protein